VLIEHRQGDVGQQRGQDPALRGAGFGVLRNAGLGHDTGLQERLHQGEHTLVRHPKPHPVHQGRMRDRIEARLDIRVQHLAVAQAAVEVDLGDRVVRSAAGPKPVRDRHEVGLEDRLQHQFQRCLNDPIRHGRDAQLA
jgi:hypothetical protein